MKPKVYSMFDKNFWLSLTVLLGVARLASSASGTEVCSLKSCHSVNASSQDFRDRCNASMGFSLHGHCCFSLQNGSVVGIDLSYCHLKNIKSMFHQMTDVLRINLTHNKDLEFENTSFVGLKKLRTLVLDLDIDCPGQWNWFNITWQSWNSTVWNKHSKRCINQTNTCEQLKEYNYTCPDHSNCVTNGPGSFQCHCDPGWGGYRCLRETGHKLQIPILSGVAGATLLASGFLWYTQRRHVL